MVHREQRAAQEHQPKPTPFPEGFKTGAWAGEPAFVMAGGPSIETHNQIHRLQDHGRIIAVNRSLELPLTPDVWLFLDKEVWEWSMTQRVPKMEPLRQAILRYKGPKVTRFVNNQEKFFVGTDVYRVTWGSSKGLCANLEKANIGSNTGFWGLGWAYALGADPIILFGVDCNPTDHDKRDKRKGNQQHFHDGYPKPPGSGSVYDSFIKTFNAGGVQLRDEGRMVFNCSPGTAVTEVPVLRSIEQALEIAANSTG
jgi:hypothetical protein